MSADGQRILLDTVARGAVYENRVTGERCVVLSNGRERGTAIVHLVVAPHGAVAGEHVHPAITERFSVLQGRLQTRIDGNERTLAAGAQATIAPGVPHDWWNAGEEPAGVIVEIDPPEVRFAMLIAMLFGLANAGLTNDRGMPGLLQGALLAHEFADVIRFTHPPAAVQAAVFPLLAALARARGLRAIDPEMLAPHGHEPPDPVALAAAGLL